MKFEAGLACFEGFIRGEKAFSSQRLVHIPDLGETLAIGPPAEGPGECGSMAAATDEQRFLLVLPRVERQILRGRSLELLPAASGSEALIRLRRDDAAR